MPVAGQFLPNPRATTPSGAADASALVHRMASLNTSTGAGHIWRAIGAANEPSVAEFTLRHFVKIARHRNAYGLMERVVRACQESDVSLEAVLNCDKRQPDVATHPHELLCVLFHREKRFQSGFAQSMPRRGATPLTAAARLPLQICSPAASTQSVKAAGLKITSRNRSTAVDLVPGVALQLRDGRLARSGVYV